jgi:outer membrane protein W
MKFKFIQIAVLGLFTMVLGHQNATGAVESASSLEAEYFDKSRFTQVHVRVSPTLGSYPTRLDSALVYGGQIGVTYRATRRTEYGLEVGYLRGSLDGVLRGTRSQLSSGMTTQLEVIPVSVTALYRLADGAVQPYIGFSFGIHSRSISVGLNSANQDGGAGSSGASSTGFGIIAYIRPGVDFALNRNLALFVEAKAGIVAGGFTLAPQLGLNVGI